MIVQLQLNFLYCTLIRPIDNSPLFTYVVLTLVPALPIRKSPLYLAYFLSFPAFVQYTYGRVLA